MITDSSFIHNTYRSSMVNKPLKRGRACMNCRFLKIKCDGMKPVCGPCRKSPKDDECEYSDGPTRSRTKALEDTVSRLEARLHELENPDDYTPSVKLFDPYSQFNSPPQQPQPQLTVSISPPPLPRLVPASFGSMPNSPYSHVPRLLASSPGSSPDSMQNYVPLTPASTTYGSSPLGIFDSQLPRRSPDMLGLDYGPQIDLTLIRKFLDHASEFGFFLDADRLVQSMRLPDGSRPSPALLYTMYLWGAHLSSDTSGEEHFKLKALQSAATDLASSAFLHTLQAEVLLSYFFFRTGAFLEARAHTATAFALALGAGLHQIRSAHESGGIQTHVDAMTGGGVSLPPPRDAVEEGERINAFWAVFVLQKNISMALEPTVAGVGVGSVFEATGPGGMQIDTPWPMEMDEYKRGLLAGIQSSSTVLNYLQTPPGAPPYPDGYGSSLIALNTKACILLHRAVYIRAQWKPTVSQRDAQSLLNAFNFVDGLIRELRAQLALVAPPAHEIDSSRMRSWTRMLLLTHSLLNAATIKLHGLFMPSDPVSRQRCLDAAKDMFKFGGIGMELQGLGYLNPMMGTLWTIAYSIFICELQRINEASATGWQTAASEKEALEAHENLRDGMHALGMFAEGSLLMRYELSKAREALDAV
ncbi:hypothetical protein FB45DRAFT_1020142 [Roridomyces roridus]|uniref:Zn(2)-C6 fungal-type domain-containing protein n=1 Tax=Roridomyces roridus TaxID=1738132 RepID=A0AAD7CGP0_9AGAR|nr:hypothetical protein FB45DRAFT_1020142 [Roridomyces roridus]